MSLIKTGAIVLSLIKSFFHAITNVAWGLISLFGFNALITYLAKSQEGFDITSVNSIFLKSELFIIEHILLFVLVFFLLYLYFEIKEIIK